MIGLALVRHGAHQQALRLRYGGALCHEFSGLDVGGAVEHHYRAPTLTELSALFQSLQRRLVS